MKYKFRGEIYDTRDQGFQADMWEVDPESIKNLKVEVISEWEDEIGEQILDDHLVDTPDWRKAERQLAKDIENIKWY